MGTPRGKFVPDDEQEALRAVICENVLLFKAKYYPPEVKYSERGFAAKVGLAPTTLRNVLAKGNGISVDTLQTIAAHVGIAPWQLLVPNLGRPHEDPAPAVIASDAQAAPKRITRKKTTA